MKNLKTKKRNHNAYKSRFGLLLVIVLCALSLSQPNVQWLEGGLGSLINYVKNKSALSVQEFNVTTLEFKLASDQNILTKTFTLDKQFTTLVVEGQWESDETGLQIRYLNLENEWSKAYPLELADGQEGMVEQTRMFSEPFVVAGSQQFELLWNNNIKITGDLTIHTVDLSAGPSTKELPSTQAITGVISRAQWGADPNLMNWTPEYSNIKLAIVHHTAGSADADPAVIMRSIYYFHSVTNGWGDIGYNFVIDPAGRIYEGRAGGDNVIGGHALGFNTGSLGISLMGNYENSVPTTAALNSLARLIGERFTDANINPLANITFNGKKLATVSGHRDVGATACPGANLYGKLPAVRQQAAQLVTGVLPYPDGSYIKGSTNAIYYIDNSKKRRFTRVDTYKSWNKNKGYRIVDDYILNQYSDGTLMGFAPGSAIKNIGKSTVYFIDSNEKLRAIPNLDTFNFLKLKWSNVINVSASLLNLNLTGERLNLPKTGDFISTANTHTIYRVENNKKRPFPNLTVWLSWKTNNVINLEEEFITLYEVGKTQGFADGTLIKTNTSNTIYVVLNDMKHNFPDTNTLNILGYNINNTIIVSQEDLDLHETGPAISLLSDGTLVKGSTNTIYFMENGKKRPFRTYNIYKYWKGNKTVLSLSSSYINMYQTGLEMGMPDGLVLKSDNSSAVFLIVDGKKRAFDSPAALYLYGYSFNDVKNVTAKDLSYNPEGTKIKVYADFSLIKSVGSSTIYRLENGMKRPFPTNTIFNTWYANPDIIILEQFDIDVYSEGRPMGFANGILIRAEGSYTVYLIENGYKRRFATADAFLGMGFSWSAIIQITAQELQYNPTGEVITVDSDTSIPDDNNTNNERGVDIRVGIVQNNSVTIKTLGAAQVLLGSGNTILKSLSGGQTVTFSWSNGQYSVSGAASYAGTSVPKIQSTDTTKPAIEVTSYEDRPAWNTTINDNLFRGKIELAHSNTTGQNWVINRLPLEDYIYGIAETSNSSHPEFQKALLTAARTYAQYVINIGGKHATNNFDVHNKTDQVYRGYNFELRSPNTVAAANVTRGQMITYNGNVIVTPYFSSSDGRTRAWTEVWGGTSKAWLVSVNDPNCAGRTLSGHGVGLSGYGALKMAEQGSNWKQILQYYYTGVQVQSRY